MDESQYYKCFKEDALSDMHADIRVLTKTVEENEKKIQRVKDKCEIMNDLSTTMSIMSLSLEHIVEHNKRQDDRQEKQDLVVENQNKTLVNINQNLSELNQGQRNLDHKVENLERRVDISEERSTINILDIAKEDKIGILKKYAYPMGAGAAVLAAVLQILKILKG